VSYDDFPQSVKTISIFMRHLRFPPIRSYERRAIKSEKQTTEDFARVTLMKNPGRRIAGTIVRLFRYQGGLRYGFNHNTIVDLKGQLHVISEIEDYIESPLVLESVGHSSERKEQMSKYDDFRRQEKIEV